MIDRSGRSSELSGRGGFIEVLRQGGFRLIWTAQVLAQLGDKFLMFSLIILAYRLSHGSKQVAFTLLAYTVPAVVIAPLAGVFADRHDRKLIMWTTSLGRALIVALIPLSARIPVFQNDFWHLIVLTFAFSAVGQLFSPAEAAAIPTVVAKRSLMTANSMVMMTMVLTLLGGGALAPVVSRVDIYAPYWWAAALFTIAAVLILLAPIPRIPLLPRDKNRHPFRQVLVEVSEGLTHLGRSRVLMGSFLQLSLAVLVMFTMFTLAPAYVSTVVGITDQDSYLVLGPASAGAILGSVLLGQFGRGINRRWLISLGLLATGATLIGLATLPSLSGFLAGGRHDRTVVLAVFSLALGLEFGTLIIPAATYIMERTEDQVRGRVFSLLYMVVNGLTALPVLVAATLSDAIGTATVIGWLGGSLAAAGVV
ncbi:MAG TPA: MFS transporter, partial [Candidatus Dormibacteraeota bacterium]|nr:MFS transporter [Candidatus Dormibacteraeota bacterium]